MVTDHFDDGGYTGGNTDRPALKRLLAVVEARSVDCVVVYKVDRLSRSLLDFSRIVEIFDRNGVSFAAVTRQFNTTTSIGRLTVNILLSFAQFEREIISERTRDKMSRLRSVSNRHPQSLRRTGLEARSKPKALSINSRRTSEN